MQPKQWLDNEDRRCFGDRLSRLEWLDENSPGGEYWTFPGGLMAKYLFEEARYCFAYGQFLAANLLGLAYIERTLSALFYQGGRNDLTNAGFSVLLHEACDANLISSTEFENLKRIGQKRNAYAHFRKPGHKDGVESRSIKEEEAPYEIIEKDASDVIAAVLQIVEKGSL